jgi:ferric-dicitrate binding protein FerR (iron transport regulator)
VAVSYREAQVVIGAGEEAMLTSDEQLQVIKGPEPGWLSGIFTFESEPLSQVLAEIERQFDLEVRIDPGLATESITTRFERGKLEDILEKIAYTFQLSYRQENGVVRFYSE